MLTIEIEQSQKDQKEVKRKESNLFNFALFGLGLMIGVIIVGMI